MPSSTTDVETTTWFGTETDTPSPSLPTRYTLVESSSVDPTQSLTCSVVGVILDIVDLPDGQTTLTLYEHLDPDAFDDLIDAGAEKQSHVEVRFTIDDYLLVVRSTNRILVFEPVQAPQ